MLEIFRQQADYLFRDNNRNTRKTGEVCLKISIKAPE